MTRMLYNVVNGAEGTAKRITLRNTIDVAGKTGTAGNDYDRWFVGYTPYYVGAAWYGYSYPKSIGSDVSNPSTRLFDLVMTKLHEDIIAEANASADDDIVLKTFDDNRPYDVEQVEFCIDSGEKPAYACSLDPRGNRTEIGYFSRSNKPFTACDTHIIVKYDSDTKAVAHEYSSRTYDVALIKENTRAFPYQIEVRDAQYVYRNLPYNVKPGGWWGVPFFINAIPSDTYVGSSNVESQFNRFSYENYNFSRFDPVVTTEATTTAVVPVETTVVTTAETTVTTAASSESIPESVTVTETPSEPIAQP